MLTVPLPQVLSGNLLPDAVSWFFTGVLKGLQTHGQHDGCMAALVHLAFQIYEALVRSCSSSGRGVGWGAVGDESHTRLGWGGGANGPRGWQLHCHVSPCSALAMLS